MPAKERTKGHDAERAVVRYLRQAGFQLATTSRAALGHDGFRQDTDIIGIPGVALEVKNRRELNIGPALTQCSIAGGPTKIPIVVAKPYGVGLESVHHWWAITYFSEMVQLFPETGDM